jgi:hypothetical protein
VRRALSFTSVRFFGAPASSREIEREREGRQRERENARLRERVRSVFENKVGRLQETVKRQTKEEKRKRAKVSKVLNETKETSSVGNRRGTNGALTAIMSPHPHRRHTCRLYQAVAAVLAGRGGE